MSIFDDVKIEEETPLDHILQGCKESFSQYCDAVLHGLTCFLIGENYTVTDECRYLEQKGYYIPDFHMIDPFYYLGESTPVSHLVRGGSLFLKISESEDLGNLHIPYSLDMKPEVLERIPVVLFRLSRKYISITGPCEAYEDDLIHHLHGKDEQKPEGLPLYEFIGVFKAELKGQDKGRNVYKMTKIFDRYYFDDTKIK